MKVVLSDEAQEGVRLALQAEKVAMLHVKTAQVAYHSIVRDELRRQGHNLDKLAAQGIAFRIGGNGSYVELLTKGDVHDTVPKNTAEGEKNGGGKANE